MKIRIINCFDTYEHRVELLLEYFLLNKHEVSVITSNFKHREKVFRVEKKDFYQFVPTKVYKKNLSINRLKSHWILSKDIFENLDQDIDLLWIMVPPNSFVKKSLEFKKNNPNTLVVLDFIDMWPETLPVGKIKNLFPFSFWKKLRDSNLKKADFIVTECNLYQTLLKHKVIGSKMSTLYLSYGNIDNEKLLPCILPKDKLSLCYLGSINNIIDIDCISKILKNISLTEKIDFHIIGDGEKKSDLISKSKFKNVTVIDHGKIYDSKKKLEILNSCHYGLNIMKKSVFVGLTMKSLDYFKVGLPIINNIKGDTWEFVISNNIGVNTSNGELTLSPTNYDISQRERVRNFYQENFSKDAIFKGLDSIIKTIS
ncbi:glycosyltransferase [Streptococcus pluranimalium]|uniref:glycosyltransferase n=1 Tax=Streptococcus pluranimalium TaxID=82348 RepID=UPI004046FC46